MKDRILAALFLICTHQLSAQDGGKLVRGNAPGEWRYWAGDAWSTRYSPLDQINASNFDSLQAPRQFSGRGLAYWTDGRDERAVVVTPGYHLISLDAKTGTPDPKFGKSGIVDLMEGLGLPIVPLAVDDSGPLVISDGNPARQARPGEKWDPVTKTGADGTMGIDPALGQIANSSPAIVVNDVIVVGNSAIHGYYPIRAHNLPGFIRGFDVHSGKQLWKFNLIPQAGEFGAETWKKGTKVGTEGVGKIDAWATYTADPELGLVYIPVGMGLMDEYGGLRPGANLFANSVVAIDVKTGLRKWHYQFVHHDIWDYDTPMAPNLLDVTVNGQRRRIIAATTKQGWVYVLDRATGEPIWPIVETPVLQSEVPGEQTWPTQPIPRKPAPYSQQGLVESDVIDYTPAIKDSALKIAKRCRMGPYYIPGSATDGSGPSGYKCSWYAPGASGGVNIDGGAAADPETGRLFVGSQSGLSTIQLQKDPCSEFPYSSIHDSCGLIGALPPPPGYTKPDHPIGGFEGRGSFSNIGGISILKPKQLGGITAYDLNTGDKAWWTPNGGKVIPVTSKDPLFAGVQLPPSTNGRGQPEVIATKTLVIYGAGRLGVPGQEPQMYAVDKATGKQVGAIKLASNTTAVPMTFLHQGRQYIVYATGAGKNTALVALALPAKP